jgi:hypothetical protein
MLRRPMLGRPGFGAAPSVCSASKSSVSTLRNLRLMSSQVWLRATRVGRLRADLPVDGLR